MSESWLFNHNYDQQPLSVTVFDEIGSEPYHLTYFQEEGCFALRQAAEEFQNKSANLPTN